MSVSQSLTLTESNVVNSANTSKVRILWKSTQSGDSWNGYTRTAKYYVSINGGAETEYLVNYTLPQNSTATIVDTTITVNHKSDGSGTVAVRTWMDTRISAGVVTQSKSLNLTTIPRASSLDALSCSTAYFDGTLTYKYTPKSASYYNRCNIYLNLNGTYTTVKTINLGQKATSQQTATVTLAESELAFIYNKLPSLTKGTLRFTFRTYSDSGYSTKIGDETNWDITLTIPNVDATQPTAIMTLTPVSSLSSPFNTLYIKGKSKVSVALTGGEGKYGASISSYTASVGGASGAAPYTSGYFTKAEEVTITGTVADSRGYFRKYTQTITVTDYSAPQIIPISGESEVVAARCDSGGNIVDNGTYLKIKAKRNYSKVNISGVNKNLCYIRYRYKAEGGSYSDWTTILATTATSDEIVTGALLGTLDVMSTYLVQVQAVDTIGETGTTTISLPTERVYMHKAGSINSIGIGKHAEDPNTVDIAKDIDVKIRGALLCLEIPEYTDLDKLTKPNRYYGNEAYFAGYANCPTAESVTFSLEVISLGASGQVLQRFTVCSTEATVYERQYFGGFWREWECVNPPMHEGVEYRTKERYLGKPVYTKIVYLGALPNATVKEVAHGAGASTIIRCLGHLSHGINIPYLHHSDAGWVGIYAGTQKVVITTGSDQSDRTGYAQIWYIKD